MASKTFAGAISDFGADAKSKLKNAAIKGEPEDQLRNPLETLLHDLAQIDGLPPKAISLVGETTVKHLKSRPDFAVTVHKALVGFIEVKRPGKGADPRKFPKDSHDGEQWEKLKFLPNLLYTDGNAFSLWHDGELDGATFRDWYPKLRSGGIIAGDDYHADWPRVMAAVDRFVADYGLELHVIECREEKWNSMYPTWFAMKP